MNPTCCIPESALNGGASRVAALFIPNVRTTDGIARFAGDEARYRYWLGEFTRNGPASVAQIRSSIASGSRETATRLVHAFRGRAGMLGMIELHSIALSLEMSLRDNETPAPWLADLESTVDEIIQAIADALDTAPN